MMCEYYAKDNEKVNIEKTEAEKLLVHFKDKLSKETEEFVIETVLKNSRYIFIRKEIFNFNEYGDKQKVKRYFAYCTHCKKEYEVSSEEIDGNIKHNHSIVCEECASECIAKYTRYGRGSLIDSAIFITYDKSAIDNETIIARGYFVRRDYTKDYKSVKTTYSDLSRYIFEPGGKSSMITKYSYGGWSIRNGYCSYKDGYGNYRDYTDKESILRAINNTRFEYSPYEIYMTHRYDMTNFFYEYNRYPIIEKLVKLGFQAIADSMIYRQSLAGSIRWKQTDIFKFLGLNRAEVKEIRESGIECYPRFLNVYKLNKLEKLKWDIETIKKVSNEFDISELKKIKKYSGINKILKYCGQQLSKEKNQWSEEDFKYRNRKDVLRTWLDYLEDCKKLNIDIKDDSVLYPKDIYNAHQNTIKQIEYQGDKLLNDMIKRLASKREKYKFEYKNLLIRPALDSDELIEEGKILNHCVGGYAKNYAEDKTNILFIRKKNKPNKPFYTVEVAKDKVIQVHGKRNINPDEEVEEFIKAFKESRLSKTKKNKKVA